MKLPWHNLWRIAIITAVLAMAWIGLGIGAGILWAVWVAFILYRWDNRIIGVAALIALVSCPVLLALHHDAGAEVVAVYAYYFLVMTVSLQVIDLKRESKR